MATRKHLAHQTSCHTVYRFICDNLGADLNSPECRAIRTHLKGCPSCEIYLDSLKKTVSLYQSYPVGVPSPAARRKLFARIAVQRKKSR